MNKQLECYVSWFPEPEAFMTDAFSFSWQNCLPYIFAPFSLIGKVINKLIMDEVEKALLIVPLWRSQSWFPLLLSNLISFPIRLPRHKDLLTLTHNSQPHPLSRKLRMVAVVLSGKDCNVKEFQNQQLPLLLTHGDVGQESSMDWHGTNGIFGVIQGRSIPFVRLRQ